LPPGGVEEPAIQPLSNLECEVEAVSAELDLACLQVVEAVGWCSQSKAAIDCGRGEAAASVAKKAKMREVVLILSCMLKV